MKNLNLFTMQTKLAALSLALGASLGAAPVIYDMSNWDFDMGDGLTETNDINPGDPDTITMMFDLDLAGAPMEDELFFRIEEQDP